MRFILAVVSGELVVSNRKRAAIEADMDAMGYDRIQSKPKASPSREQHSIHYHFYNVEQLRWSSAVRRG